MKDTLIVCSDGIFKKCSKCGEYKDVIEFYPRRDRTNGYISMCKFCLKPILHQKAQMFYNNHKEIILINTKIYRNKNLKIIKHKAHVYYNKNKEHIKLIVSKYRKTNEESYKKYKKKYNSTHRVHKREWERNRLLNNEIYRLTKNLRTRFWLVLGKNKHNNTKDLCCCDFEYLMCHLQKQFRDGMTCENYGKVWHIDHIIPLSFFDMSDLTEQKIANHWGNLQPLFIKENLEKHNKIPEKTNFRY